jgi:acetoin utilization deacetylase AcuC-like enzyme
MESFSASIQAVGCVIDAIEKVVEKKAQNAFVAVRPPGHHAGYFGKVS